MCAASSFNVYAGDALLARKVASSRNLTPLAPPQVEWDTSPGVRERRPLRPTHYANEVNTITTSTVHRDEFRPSTSARYIPEVQLVRTTVRVTMMAAAVASDAPRSPHKLTLPRAAGCVWSVPRWLLHPQSGHDCVWRYGRDHGRLRRERCQL